MEKTLIPVKRRGKAVIFTAPSGAGKTTIVHHLLKQFPDKLAFSISATTRGKRENEKDGVDYYFLTPEQFKKKIQKGDFLEYQEVYKNQFYGTLKSEVQRLWDEGKTVLFDIDVKGAKRLKDYFGDDCLAVFIAPPSLEILIQRLKNRGTETEESLKKRIARIKKEFEYKNNFDKILINDNLEQAKAEAERLVSDFIE